MTARTPTPEGMVRTVARTVRAEVEKLTGIDNDLVRIAHERFTDGVAELEEAACHIRREARGRAAAHRGPVRRE